MLVVLQIYLPLEHRLYSWFESIVNVSSLSITCALSRYVARLVDVSARFDARMQYYIHCISYGKVLSKSAIIATRIRNVQTQGKFAVRHS